MQIKTSLFLLFWALVFNGCSTHHASARLDFTAPKTPIGEKLADYYQEWEGTRYSYGGLSQNGVDCSGFVYRAYLDCFRLELPRATQNQVKAGYRIPKDELKTGDLVFFRTGSKNRHVGIYIGSGKFMHASSSQGVTISHLQNPYWKKHYWFAKHIPELDTL